MFYLLPGFVLAAEQAPVCPHNRFDCLKQHLDDFYLTDHDRFYQVYNAAFMKALRCTTYKDVATYLTIHSVPNDNAEVEESVQSNTEALLLLKPKCFFEGYLLLSPEQQDNLVGSYHLFSRPNHVMQLLQQYMRGGKYKSIASRIYNANLDAYQTYGKAAEDAPMDELYAQYPQRKSR